MSKELDKESLGEVSSDAWSEFGEACRFVESTLSNAFGAEKFNYLALMMFDPEVHFHVIPRYPQPVHFEGKKFIDPDWPGATKKIALDLDGETLATIKAKILSSI